MLIGIAHRSKLTLPSIRHFCTTLSHTIRTQKSTHLLEQKIESMYGRQETTWLNCKGWNAQTHWLDKMKIKMMQGGLARQTDSAVHLRRLSYSATSDCESGAKGRGQRATLVTAPSYHQPTTSACISRTLWWNV
jgi:hypothetical protein